MCLMNITLKRKNILVVASYSNVLDKFEKYDSDDLNQDLRIGEHVLHCGGIGDIFCEIRMNTFNMTISEYYFKPEGQDIVESIFLYTKKKIRYFEKGKLNIKTIYYYQRCT